MHVRLIEEVDGALNAVVVRRFDEALGEADEADRRRAAGDPLPALHGLPVTVKECWRLAGTPATAGIASFAGWLDEADAPVVARLRAVGAIVVGKTNLSQAVWSAEPWNPVYGRTSNPHDHRRSPGASSSGEGAIVATGGSPLGLGTDSGGSVRGPAHCSGVQALVPTPGLLSTAGTVGEGLFARQSVVEASGGFLARRVEDLRLGLAALTGNPGRVPAAALRVGVYEDDGVVAPAPSVRRAVREAATALAAAGCAVSEFVPDAVDGLRIHTAAFDLTFDTVRAAVGAGPLEDSLAAAIGSMDPIDDETAARRNAELLAERDGYRARFEAAAAEIDVLVCPVMAFPAARHGACGEAGPGQGYSRLYNLLGRPAGAVAATRVRREEQHEPGTAGLPVGVQIAGRRFREADVLAVMAVLEEAFGAP